MKTTKILTLVILVMSLFLTTSCNDDDNEMPVNTHDDAYGDVILKKVNANGIIKYKLVFFAGAVDIVAADSKVTYPDGVTEFNLDSFWAGAGKLRNMEAPMSIDKPASGEFTFTLKFSDGYTKTVTNTLEDTEVDLPMPLVVDYTPGDATMTLNWTSVSDADLYCVKITKGNTPSGKPFFKKGMISNTASSFTINIDGGNGWLQTLVSGDTYNVHVAAKKVENGATVSGYSQNFQLSACLKTQIVY